MLEICVQLSAIGYQLNNVFQVMRAGDFNFKISNHSLVV